MKNLFDDVSEDKIELLKQAEIKRERKLIHTLTPQKNHILFEFDLEKREVRRAEFVKPKEISFLDAMQGNVKLKKEVDGKEGCVYVSAMNEKNAWKKFMKLFPQK